jgi:hypothetical protein
MNREQPEEDEEEDLHHAQRYVRMPPEPEPGPEASSASFRLPDSARVFDELPRARIVAVSRPDAGDITPMLLSYTVEVQYKQVRPCAHPPPLQIRGLVSDPVAGCHCVRDSLLWGWVGLGGVHCAGHYYYFSINRCDVLGIVVGAQ